MILEPPIWIANILEQHVEDLGVLWGQRLANASAAAVPRRAFRRADARILAHLDALLLARDDALPFIIPALGADYGGALTAGLVLSITGGAKNVERILAAFKAAGGPALDGLAQALAWTPLPPFREALLKLAQAGPSPQSIAAIGVLAAHKVLRPQDAPLDALLANSDPGVRAMAWRAALHLAVPRPPMVYQNGINDREPAVREVALLAAAWAAQKPLLTACRAAAQKPSLAVLPLLQLFAVVSEPADVPLLVNLARAEALGPARFDILGRSGFPALAEPLLAAIKSKDAATAAAAAHGFTCLTHFDPTSGKRVSLAASDDPFAQAFAEEVQVPDPAAAEAFWKQRGPSLASLPRITRGMPVDPAVPPQPAALLNLDCRAFLDIHLRYSFQSGARSRPGDLLAFCTTPAS